MLGGFLGRAPIHKDRAAAAAVKRQTANAVARDLAIVIDGIKEAGIISPSGTARELNKQGMVTPSGREPWQAVQVQRVLARAG